MYMYLYINQWRRFPCFYSVITGQMSGHRDFPAAEQGSWMTDGFGFKTSNMALI